MSTLDSRRSRAAGGIVFAIVGTLYFGWVIARFGLNTPPSTSGDEPSYDSIAWELHRGNGFAVDFTDREFREPYDRAAERDAELFFLPMTTDGAVAYRPPLIPLITTLGNKLFGRQHFFLRSLNVLAMAATIGLIVWHVASTISWQAAFVITVLFVADVRSRLYARALLTESLACLLGTLLALTLIRFANSKHVRLIVLSGVLLGLSILARSIAVLWIPGAAATLLGLMLLHSKHSWKQSITKCGLFCVTVLVVISPWAIRNVVLLKTFAPMGTQGLMELSAGYSDAAWENHGVWQHLSAQDFFDDSALAGLHGYTRELAIAEQSKAKAFHWIQNNAAKVPLLAAMKLRSEFRPADIVSAIVLLLAIVGAAVSIRSIDTQVLLCLILTNASAIAATWSVEGRFLVPQLFCFYVLAGRGIHACLPKRKPNSDGDHA